jgi:hypothetical protein
MNAYQIVGLVICNLVATIANSAEASPISIVLRGDFTRTHSVEVNGRRVPSSRLLDALSDSIKNPTDSVVVVMSEESRFADWEDIIAILSKVGFVNVRYFFFSKDSMKMTELELSQMPQEFSLDPPPRSSKHGNE